MPFTIYDACVPVFERGLGNLAACLEKGAAFAASQGLAEATLLSAALAPDMFSLTRQVQSASDAAKFGACRLAGVAPPVFADTETSFAELQARVRQTLDVLGRFEPAQFDDGATRTVTVGSGARQRVFDGQSYLLGFALPNFFFHVTTAYDILRHNGVPLGKRDYLGPVGTPVAS